MLPGRTGPGVRHGGRSTGNQGASTAPSRPASEPRPPATRAATAVPSLAAPTTSRPPSRPATNPAQYASPQPVVSTTGTSSAGTRVLPDVVATRLPSPPSVTRAPS